MVDVREPLIVAGVAALKIPGSVFGDAQARRDSRVGVLLSDSLGISS